MFISFRNLSGQIIYETKAEFNIQNLKYEFGNYLQSSPDCIHFSEPVYISNNKIIIDTLIAKGSLENDTELCNQMNCYIRKYDTRVSIISYQPSLKIQNIDNITHLTNLHTIEMYSANINTLPEDIHFLYNLTKIFINFCHKLEILPNNLSLCSKLKIISIKNCFQLKGNISNDLCCIQNLNIIDFFGCRQLKGSLTKIGENIKELNLSYCKNIQFNPHCLNYSSHLESLFLYGFNICNYYNLNTISSLVILIINNENLEGNMEIELKQLYQLETLKLENCRKVTGQILNNLKNWTQLKVLDLNSSINLTGCIPHHGINNSNLKYLNLSGCSGLYGKVPYTILNIEDVNLSNCKNLNTIYWPNSKKKIQDRKINWKIRKLDLSHCPNMCFKFNRLMDCNNLRDINYDNTNIYQT